MSSVKAVSIENVELNDSMYQELRDLEKNDTLIGARVGGKYVYQYIFMQLKQNGFVHAESLLCAIGALAGYACQISLREQLRSCGLSETSAFKVFMAQDGKPYYFGDYLNYPLYEGPVSFWQFANSAAFAAGANEALDCREIFAYNASVVGTERFGIPQIAPEHMPLFTPKIYLETLWLQIYSTLRFFCPSPWDWPILLAYSAHKAITDFKEILDPKMAIKILMESAIPMSKMDAMSLTFIEPALK